MNLPQAIFFDVGNTLLFRDQSVILAPLHQRGIIPSAAQLHAVERKTKREFDESVLRGGDVDHGFWHTYYTHLLEDFDGPEIGPDNAGLREQLVSATRISANWCEIVPGTRDVLLRLRPRYKLGVISNADGRIANVLAHCGIADCFETITDSGLVGSEKPNPAIFQAALRALGVTAAESLYVGDVYSVDYLGATGSDMQAILFDVCGAYRDDGLPRVESMEELEMVLDEAWKS